VHLVGFITKKLSTSLFCIDFIIVMTNKVGIQSVSPLQGITARGDFLGLCDEKSSHKYVSDFGRLRSYDRFLIPVHALV